MSWVITSGLSSLGVPGVPWHTQILADQLTLYQPGGTDYAHLITTGTPGFSDGPVYFESESLFPPVFGGIGRIQNLGVQTVNKGQIKSE